MNQRLATIGSSEGPFRGYGAEVGVRGFVWGKAPEGAWVMVRGILASVVLSGGLGISYFSYGPAYGIHGFLPAAHTAIGWAF